MFNRLSAVWLVVGVVAGYAAAGRSVTAQNVPANPVPPFVNPGDDVTLYLDYERSGMVRCAVAEIQGIWIRCAPADKLATQARQRWFSLNRAIEIEKGDSR